MAATTPPSMTPAEDLALLDQEIAAIPMQVEQAFQVEDEALVAKLLARRQILEARRIRLRPQALQATRAAALEAEKPLAQAVEAARAALVEAEVAAAKILQPARRALAEAQQAYNSFSYKHELHSGVQVEAADGTMTTVGMEEWIAWHRAGEAAMRQLIQPSTSTTPEPEKVRDLITIPANRAPQSVRS